MQGPDFDDTRSQEQPMHTDHHRVVTTVELLAPVSD
jgi:hypothetical protein